MASSPEATPSQGNDQNSPPADSASESSPPQSPPPPIESPPTTSSPPPPPSPSPPAVSPPPDPPTTSPPPPNQPASPPPPTPTASPPPDPPQQSTPSPSTQQPPPSQPPPTQSTPPTDNSPTDPPPTTTPSTQSPPPPPTDSNSPPTQNASPSPPSGTTPSSPEAPTNTPPAPGSPPITPGSPLSPTFPTPPQQPGTVAPPTPPSAILSPPSPGSALPSPDSSSGSKSGVGGIMQSSNSTAHVAIIAGIVFGGVLILALFIICLIFTRRRRKTPRYTDPEHPLKGGDQQYNSSDESNTLQPFDHIAKISPSPLFQAANNTSDYSSGYSGQNRTPGVPLSPNMGGIGSKSQFTYEELATATSGFSQGNLLGQGGFGLVHKGILPDGKEVAVKSLKSGSGQGEREFQAEVEIISRVHHRHLVSLVGYCIADGQRMLVYEFVANKTLEFHLHGKGQPVMDWASRLRIAVGSAKGLAYLHEDCHPRIIHRDIKAANILLDFNCEAMVADFGLAKLTSDNITHVSTRVMGTFGYLAPEYASSGKLSEKSDVFSFGVMLLELITGRRPVDTTNMMMEDSLVDWARPRLSKALEDGNYGDLVDPRLEDSYDPQEMARMIGCAAASIRHSARRRPKMSQIVRALDGDSSLDDLNEGVKPGQSTVYNPNGNTEKYDTGAYNADMTKFRKMVMSSQEFNSSEYGATSDYGHTSLSSSNDNSTEMVRTNSTDTRKV